MLIRKVPGAVGQRSARYFTGASTQYLEAATGLGLGATDPFSLVVRAARGSTDATTYVVSIGRSGSDSNYRGIRTSNESNARATSADNGGTTANANSGINEFGSANGWISLIAEFASTTSRRIITNGTVVSDSTSNTPTLAPTHVRIGVPLTSTGAFTGGIAHAAVFAGAVSDTLIAMHRRGVHPTQLPGQLIECWDLDRVGPIVGLVRGTVLSPVNGGGLAVGPAIQGPPTLRRFFVGAPAGGGTDYTLSADAGATTIGGVAASLEWARRVAADAASTALNGVNASLKYGRETAAAAGAAIVSGVNAALRYARRLVGAQEAVTITGGTAVLERDRVLKADAGAVTITGQAATLTYSGGTPAPRKTMMLMGVQK